LNTITINADLGVTKISKHIYGHFAEHLGRCVYEGLWVGPESKIPNTRGFRKDVVKSLRQLQMPNLRWPGGCFADTYHWMDGIGPRAKRPSIVNIHWGGVTENNHVGTHEFLDLCEQLSSERHVCEPYICGNVGSGTVREMAQWIEYLTMAGKSPMSDLRRKNGRKDPWPNIKYWAVGNENWGCGGQMRAEHYADLYRQYATYCRHFGGGKNKLYKIACGFLEDWNETIIRECGRFMDGLSIHYYAFTTSWEKKGPATGFPVSEWFSNLNFALKIEGFIARTSGQLDRHDPDKRIGIIMDEWGNWHLPEPGSNPAFLYQQNTVRDALVAGLSLNIFNKHAARVHMANIAQTVNVLQAMILTEGPKMVLTPTYHVFDLYKGHQDATLLPTHVKCGDYSMDGNPDKIPQISASASRAEGGKILLTLCNLHHEKTAKVKVDLRGADAKTVTGRIVTGPKMDSMNTFEKPTAVTAQAFDETNVSRAGLNVALPPASVVALELT
jgi:alpha-N-arabinofuranosidase